ncbi:dienelactone hydrolase family protein [Comamonas faecalis]|uniref:Dienelactone hydrolase family protein n=1 Tax=Comamonas faecalis TaxID=1387849 RepID=A0ABP7RL85_9BURK
MNAWITLTSADGTPVRAWQAQPAAGAPQRRAAVVVLPEIFGVNSHIRAVAEQYAAEGYLALAIDTFARVEPGVELGYGAADMQRGIALKAAAEALPTPGVQADIEAAVRHAGAASGGKVGVVGFCWGGLLAWRAACAVDGLSAAVCYYGGGMTNQTESARSARVPVLAHFGERDHFIPAAGVQAFAQAHPDAQVHLYAADHGFNCDQRASYDAPATQAARERTLAFFARHLGA